MAIVRDQTDISASTTTTPFPRGVIAFHIPAIVKWDDMSSMDCSFSETLFDLRLLESEIHGQVVDDGNRLTVECTWPEFPSLDCFERRLVESHRERFENARVADVALPVDDGLDDHDPFDARFP